MTTPPDRRAALALLASLAAAPLLLAAGCATPLAAPDRIVDIASGRDLTRAELLATLRQADVVLLGELHDNPHHHQRRGALLVELGPRAAVVAEQMPRGARVAPGADLRARLEAVGFDGWYVLEQDTILAEPVEGGPAVDPAADVRRSLEHLRSLASA